MSILYIDSADRTTGSANNFTYQLGVLSKFDKIALLAASIPNTLYNVTAVNNTIYWNDGSARTATVPAGYYNATELAIAMNTAMDLVGTAGPFTVTFSPITGKMTIGGTNAFTLTTGNATNAIWPATGFSTGATGTYSTGFVGNQLVDLNSVPALFVNIGEAGNPVVTTHNGRRFTFVVPVNNELGGAITYAPEDSFKQVAACKIVSALTISLCLKDGTPVDLRGQDWSVVLKLE